MIVRAGTSGFQYKPWRGAFYPEDMKERDMLAFYSQQLPTVEINNTFYRMPKASVVEKWASEVGDDFRFVIKASRRITHFKRLKEPEEPLGYLLGSLEHLGSKQGPILFQLPPNMKVNVERLAAFLAALPEETKAAFEFRHASWYDDAVYEVLGAHNASLVMADGDEQAAHRVATADWGYLRLRRIGYDESALKDWAEWVQEQSWSDAYVFFKHEDAGAGPKMARRFLELVGPITV